MSKKIVIFVDQGVVQEVYGLPPGISYEILDFDVADQGNRIELSKEARDVIPPELLEEVNDVNKSIQDHYTKFS